MKASLAKEAALNTLRSITKSVDFDSLPMEDQVKVHCVTALVSAMIYIGDCLLDARKETPREDIRPSLSNGSR